MTFKLCELINIHPGKAIQIQYDTTLVHRTEDVLVWVKQELGWVRDGLVSYLPLGPGDFTDPTMFTQLIAQLRHDAIASGRIFVILTATTVSLSDHSVAQFDSVVKLGDRNDIVIVKNRGGAKYC